MKKVFNVIVFLLLSQFSFGQGSGVCDWGSWGPYLLDSSDFSGGQGINFFYEIDTTFPNNIWQIGAVSKNGFPVNAFGNNAIQTDTLNPYDTNNVSAFYVWTDSVTNFFSGDSLVSIHFWHYYDVDSLGDSCVVQMTLDSGKTWIDYSNFPSWPQPDYDYQAPVNIMPHNSGKFLWTGKSNAWQQVKICFTYFAIKPSRSMSWPVGFRFLFISDSIQTNKAGWVIDKIRLRTPASISGLNDFKRTALPIYPNPSTNGKFTIDFPSNYVTGKFYVYDFLGRNIKTVPLSEQIDLSDLPQGLYSYKALFNKTEQWFSGKVEIH